MKKFNPVIAFFVLCALLAPHSIYSQWYRQQIPVNKPVTGIKFIDTLNGWASTGDFLDTSQTNPGYIIHTTNGGTNWLIQFSKAPFAFSAMTMVNNLIGYAAGDSLAPLVGKVFLYKTTNGGINWISIPIQNNMFVSNFFFLSADTGWEVSSAGAGPDVRLTTDGGFTWQVRTSGITSSTNCIFFLNYNTGYCGADWNLYKTTNAGLSWILNGTFSNIVSSVFFINENTGWIGLAGYYLGYTTNGGANWITQNLPPLAQSATLSLLFFNNIKGYAGDGINNIFKTLDGGLNWGFQIDTGGQRNISFVDSTHGWTSPIYSGYVEHTTNGGGQITYVGIINNQKQIPRKYVLYQNFPNPFNSQTTIRFSLSKSSFVKLKIYDVLGHERVIWENNKMLEAGTHELSFDAGDYASGVYFYELTVSDSEGNTVFKGTKKMILIK